MTERITPGSTTPRLFFRWYNDDETPKTDGAAAAISAAEYVRRSSGVWPASGTSVGSLVDAAEGAPYSVGRVIRHPSADGLGNLYSVDPPVAAAADGADAVRLLLTVSAGSVDVLASVLDHPVGSRSVAGDDMALATAAVDAVASANRAEMDSNSSRLAAIATDADRIPAIPATESTAAAAQAAAEKVAAAYDADGTVSAAAVAELAGAIRAEMDASSSRLAAIATDADRIPANPATESTAAAAQAAAEKVAAAYDADGTLTAAALGEIVAGVDAGVTVDVATLAAAVAAQLQLAAVRREGEAGPLITDRIVTRGTTWRIGVPFDLPADWTRVEFTARVEESDDQAASLLHVAVSDPAGDDGLQVWRGSTDVTRGDASIATDGSPVVILAASVAAAAAVASYRYDCKVWTPDGLDQVVRGTLYVEADVTRSTAA